MPQAGDSFTVEVKSIHIGWGQYPKRRSLSRKPIYGEGYIKIPRAFAKKYDIFNSNKIGANILYSVTTINGCNIQKQLLAQGCSAQGNQYAKQFSVQGNLKVIGGWYQSVNAQPGGKVEVRFTSSTSLTIEYI